MRVTKHEVENGSNASVDCGFGVILLPVIQRLKSVAKKNKNKNKDKSVIWAALYHILTLHYHDVLTNIPLLLAWYNPPLFFLPSSRIWP